MTSLSKIAANRRNAGKSTGPRTKRGKKHSRFNALATGFYAHSRVIPGEKEQHYETLRTSVLEELKPDGVMEHAICDQIISDIWRLQRMERAEQNFLTSFLRKRAQGLPSQFSEQNSEVFDICLRNMTDEALVAVQKEIGNSLLKPKLKPSAADIDFASQDIICHAEGRDAVEFVERQRRCLIRGILQNYAMLDQLQARRAIESPEAQEEGAKDVP